VRSRRERLAVARANRRELDRRWLDPLHTHPNRARKAPGALAVPDARPLLDEPSIACWAVSLESAARSLILAAARANPGFGGDVARSARHDDEAHRGHRSQDTDCLHDHSLLFALQ